MDPLSVTASVIAVLQAANAVISVCYDFSSILAHRPWSLTHVINEVQDLRNTLEAVERLAQRLESNDVLRREKLGSFALICDRDKGPLVRCQQDLRRLEERITPKSTHVAPISVRRALFQAMGWRLQDKDAKASLESIGKVREVLNMLLTADSASLLVSLSEITHCINESVQNVDTKLAKLLDDVDSKEQRSMLDGLMHWLSAVEPLDNHEAAIEAHKTGTSAWLLASAEFQSWYQRSNPLLWISGFPGSGKTILFSTAVSFFQRSPPDNKDVCMAYFYCDFRKPESQDPLQAVASIVQQICAQTGHIPDNLRTAYQRRAMSAKNKPPTAPELTVALKATALKFNLVILIDALDECKSRAPLLHLISDLLSSTQNVRFLVTSRDEPDISDALNRGQRLRLESHLGEMSSDILSYVDLRLQEDGKLKWLNDSMKKEVGKTLFLKASGMFRWVQCQLDAIASLKTIRAVKTTLTRLPKGLTETYDRILQDIEEFDAPIVRKILMWLAFAVAPLTIEELHEAIAIEPGKTSVDEESQLSDPTDILELCGNLVTVNERGSVVLSHLSVKDYLLSDHPRNNPRLSQFALNKEESVVEIAQSCLTYLFFEDFGSGPSPSLEDYLNRFVSHRFINHASTFWSYYVRAAPTSADLTSQILRFFSPGSRPYFMSWVQAINARDDIVEDWDFYPPHATSMYYASSFGLAKIVRQLVLRPENLATLNAPGSRFGGTAFHAAVMREHVDVMQILLDAGADVNQGDKGGITPLHTAASYGNPHVIGLLLRQDADADAKDAEGLTPRHWAVRYGPDISKKMLCGEGDNLGVLNWVNDSNEISYGRDSELNLEERARFDI